MKRTVMAIMLTGAMLLAAGNAAMAADETGGAGYVAPEVTSRSANRGEMQAGGLLGGVVGSRAQAGGLNGGVVGSRVLAGGLTGGVVGSRVLAGGLGGGVVGSITASTVAADHAPEMLATTAGSSAGGAARR